jgi:hypothetical protein
MVAVPNNKISVSQSWADSLGGLGATLCAIHCALLPILLALVPAIGFGFFASGLFERGFLLFATTVGLGSLGYGYRHHDRRLPFELLASGLLTISAAIWIPPLHASTIAHAVAMTCGGLLIALAHWKNLSLRRTCQGTHAPVMKRRPTRDSV